MESTGEIKLHFEGVLEKAGKRFFEGFRKRWFILDGKDLTYYKAPEYTDENYLGKIDLSQVKSVNPSKAVNNGFQIITRTRTYTFSAATPELSTDWLSVLRQAMQLKSFQSRRNSRADSIESQYEEVDTRSHRSVSVASELSDISCSNETDELFYESIGPTKKPPSYSTGACDYEFIPVTSKNKSPHVDVNDGTYDLIGGPPSSSNKAADSPVEAPSCATASSDSIYGLVGPASSPVGAPSASPVEPEYGLVGPPSSPIGAVSDVAREVSGPQSDTAYGTVGSPSASLTYETVKRRSMPATTEFSACAGISGDVPSKKDEADAAENGFEGSSQVQYAQVRKPKSKCAEEKEKTDDDLAKSRSNGASLPRYGSLKQQRMLSIISEDGDDVDKDEGEEGKVDIAPPASPYRTGGANTTYAITEMKRLLEQERQLNSAEREDEGHIADKESLVQDGSGSAFELLKQLLQRLDSQVE